MEGIIGTIVGTLLGGLISWWHGRDQRTHELRKEKRDLLLAKYERLHELLGEAHGYLNELAMQVISEAAFDLKFDNSKIKSKMLHGEITMLIEFYVPELKEEFSYIDKRSKSLSETVVRFIAEENKTQEFKVESVAMASELMKVISKTIISAKEKLASVAGEALKTS
jgi:macrodomain Ter protein organizer (MatP/YcbG family)